MAEDRTDATDPSERTQAAQAQAHPDPVGQPPQAARAYAMSGDPVAEAVAQANLLTLGTAPAYGLAMTMLQSGNANGVLFANMVNAQQQSGIAGQAATVEAVIRTFGQTR